MMMFKKPDTKQKKNKIKNNTYIKNKLSNAKKSSSDKKLLDLFYKENTKHIWRLGKEISSCQSYL